MNFLVLSCLLIFISSAYQLDIKRLNSTTNEISNQNKNVQPKLSPRIDLNVNDRVDKKLEIMREFLFENGYDPMDIPDIEKPFSIKPAFITYYGKLKLKRGWLQDIRTISRLGDAFAKLNVGKQLVRLSLVLPNLEFGFDYSAKLLHMGPTGGIIGNIKDIQIYLEMYYYIIKDYYQIKFSDLYDIGKIDLKLTGNILTDPIANLFVDAVTKIVHEEIISIVNSTIYNAIDDINGVMKP